MKSTRDRGRDGAASHLFSDDEVIEATVMDRWWQLVLDCLDQFPGDGSRWADLERIALVMTGMIPTLRANFPTLKICSPFGQITISASESR